MTYSKLLELIEGMSDEQKAMPVIVNCAESYMEVSMVTEVAFADEPDEGEPFDIGQPILV